MIKRINIKYIKVAKVVDVDGEAMEIYTYVQVNDDEAS